MALALTVNNMPGGSGEDNTQRRTVLAGTAVLSGTYPSGAGGEPITWTSLNSASGNKVLINSLTPTAPLWVEFQVGTSGAAPQFVAIAQYNYTTGKLQLFGMGTAATEGTLFEEFATSFSYPAALTGAKLYWKAEFANEA